MWKQVLIRELATVVVLKLAVLFLIWHAFFAQPGKPEVTPHSVDRILLGSSRNTSNSPFNQFSTQE
jgi:hypothetical protein